MYIVHNVHNVRNVCNVYYVCIVCNVYIADNLYIVTLIGVKFEMTAKKRKDFGHISSCSCDDCTDVSIFLKNVWKNCFDIFSKRIFFCDFHIKIFTFLKSLFLLFFVKFEAALAFLLPIQPCS